MKLTEIMGSGDPGSFLKQELEEGLEPITSRVDDLEKKLDRILSTLVKIEVTLKKIEPVAQLLNKLPFLK
jgi:hypothetical protein